MKKPSFANIVVLCMGFFIILLGVSSRWAPTHAQRTLPTATATSTATVVTTTTPTATVTPIPTPTIEDVEIKIRAFIPCEAVDFYDVFDAFQDQMYGGDGRTFNYDQGTSRLDKTVIVTTDPLREPRISPPQTWTVDTTQYSEDDGEEIPGLNKPWCKNLKPGAVPEVKSQTISDIATVFRTNEGVMTKLNIDLGNPFAFGVYPNTNGIFNIHIRQNGSSPPQYRITGNHDGFPAYEIYINRKLVYCYNPIDSGDSPASLLGGSDIVVDRGVWQDISEIECKPAFGIRSNSSIGEPGSVFTITGNQFTPSSSLDVKVNNVSIGTVTADATGRFVLGLQTGNADPGLYTVTMSTKDPSLASAQSASVKLEIRQNTFLVQAEQGANTIADIPSGIAEPHRVFVPLLSR